MAVGDADPPPAGDMVERVLATAVDGLAQLLLLVPIAATVAVLWSVDPSAGPLSPAAPAGLLVGVVLAPFVVVGYHVWLEGRYAETPGKRLFDLRVVDASGAPVTWRGAVLRNVLRPIDALPFGYLVGGAVAWVDDHHRRLGDVAASTLVVDREHERPGARDHHTLQDWSEE